MTSSTAIGIMSGTSVDGIDAVLLQIGQQEQPKIIATHSLTIPKELRTILRQLVTPGDNEIDLAGYAHTELGELYAQATKQLIQKQPGIRVSVIGCHGQTIRHRPNAPYPFTLQIGNGALLCQRTGIPVVTDFRSADVALAGQGAPFAPIFHRAVFSSADYNRAIVNLGGIANITLLPKDANRPVIGFDTGPANCLLDGWIEKHQGATFDKGGRWAGSGKVDEELLNMLLDDPYFTASPPKSTGREYFDLFWLQTRLDKLPSQPDPVSVQTTLAWLSATSIVQQIPNDVDQLFLCGGGAKNNFLRQTLQSLSNLTAKDTSELGIDPQWVEASAFAWMAFATLNKTATTLPSVTGASKSSIAGAIYFP